MKWFKNVFIKSLDEQFDLKDNSNHREFACSSIWISEKQVSICLKYMKEKPTFSGYYIKIDGFCYSLTIMKKGYGRLTREDRRISAI